MPAMYTTLAASGRAANDFRSSRSHPTVSIPHSLSWSSRPGDENRDTPISRRLTHASSDALFAIRARVGPIFPATPRTMMSPSSCPSESTVASVGSLNRSSNSTTSRIEVFSLDIASGSSATTAGRLYSNRSVYNPCESSKIMRLRTMTMADISAGLGLSRIAGWNQTAADWERFLKASPGGCFAAELDGKVYGTVTTISYENRFAWIGMVLVDPQHRSKGIGTKLLEAAIKHLDDR